MCSTIGVLACPTSTMRNIESCCLPSQREGGIAPLLAREWASSWEAGQWAQRSPAPRGKLQSRIDRLTLQGQDAEYTFVHSAERLLAHEALQCLDAKRKFPQGKRPLGSYAPDTKLR